MSEPSAPERVAPPLTGRIHYLVGGMLPAKYLEWVRADLIGPGWRHRQALRPVLLMLPFAIAFAILPGNASLRVSIPLALLLCALVMGYTTSDNFRNRRLGQYGIPRPKPPEWEGESSGGYRAAPDATGEPASRAGHANTDANNEVDEDS